MNPNPPIKPAPLTLAAYRRRCGAKKVPAPFERQLPDFLGTDSRFFASEILGRKTMRRYLLVDGPSAPCCGWPCLAASGAGRS